MNNLNIKIAFFDIDGTLTNSQKEITSTTIDTLNKISKKGIDIVLCTGRSNTYVLNLTKNINTINYIISSNGARIYDVKKNENIYTNKLNVENINKVWDFFSTNKISCILVSNNLSYVNKYADITSINNKNGTFEKITNINEIKNKDLYQIIAESTETKKMYNLEKFLKNYKELKLINYTYNYINKNYCFFDIVNNIVNKGDACKYLLKELNINKENAICFGDSVNDFDMFETCGISVAMGNAIDELKNISDYITDTNDNNGISKFFDN